ncbi:hypothetical protein [Pantoea trifolii]|uniref:hypothetical protein n=1 Tax=Candidatus Pantoea symbiotica TaxID=1884370 RepID=UPI0024135D91|nr:hypothetical protein [Pantoea rodasii]
MTTFALIPDNSIVVENTIVAEDGFSLDGYYLIEIKSGVSCQSGMFYNSKDGLFYVDEKFKVKDPVNDYYENIDG